MPSLDDDVMLETILSALQSEPNTNASGPLSALSEAFNRSRALMSASTSVQQAEETSCGVKRTLSPHNDQISEPIPDSMPGIPDSMPGPMSGSMARATLNGCFIVDRTLSASNLSASERTNHHLIHFQFMGR
mmetsp:Transcript_38534/g.63878  ORF Transcript_38534/g.63878 Transcript_38534/m.63878 type:complete len:132 (+) Transcript_38534:131-526(+)